jgi:hypothetical protein
MTQANLDKLKSQLTAEDVIKLKDMFKMNRHQWNHAWKVSPKRSKYNIGLVRAAKERIALRAKYMNNLVKEVDQMLNEPESTEA